MRGGRTVTAPVIRSGRSRARVIAAPTAQAGVTQYGRTRVWSSDTTTAGGKRTGAACHTPCPRPRSAATPHPASSAASAIAPRAAAAAVAATSLASPASEPRAASARCRADSTGSPTTAPSAACRSRRSAAAACPAAAAASSGCAALHASLVGTERHHALPTRVLRIGRADDNDVVLADLRVSRRHAELRRSPGGEYEIADLDSYNGTFLNGQRITRAVVTEADDIGIGLASFRLVGDELHEFVDTGDISLEARGLTVTLPSGKVLLDDVSFPAQRPQRTAWTMCPLLRI
jgi:hypothetical protein